MRSIHILPALISIISVASTVEAQHAHMGRLYQLKDAKTRSISPENTTGEKGKGGMATLEEGSAARAARELGQGWKVKRERPLLLVRSKAQASSTIFG